MSGTTTYSGMECLVEAANELKHPVDLFAILSSKTSGSQQADSSNRIAALASGQGLHAQVLGSIDAQTLLTCPQPIILHVMGGRYSQSPDYFILRSAAQGERVEIFNPTIGKLTLPVNQLESDRRGEAIILSTNALKAPPRFSQAADVQVGVILTLAAGAVFLRWRWKGSAQPGALRPILRASALLIIGVIFALASRVASGRPLLPQPTTVAGEPIDFFASNAAATSSDRFKLVQISLQSALQRYSANALFVDARDPAEYSAGHIRGAILCPASDLAHWSLHMAGIDLARPLVVYCAEASCHKGEYVATFLSNHGFASVQLYRDGWAKWTGPKEGQ